MKPIDLVLSKLSSHTRSGNGWSARCPAHADSRASLSISEGENGMVLLTCHAGCTFDAVCDALGVMPRELFKADSTLPHMRAPRCRRNANVTETPQSTTGKAGFGNGDAKAFPTADDAVAELERKLGVSSATWTYHNTAGEPVGMVVRWNKPGGGKDIRPVSRQADGSGWHIGGLPEPRPLYALPELLATKPGARVYVVEGEKAADAAKEVGLTATTSPHGARSANKADWAPLAGRDVVILPDHDDAGERYAEDVLRLATAAGAKSVRIVRLVELWTEMPQGGDMADFMEHRGGVADAIRADVEALAEKTEPETVTPDSPAIPAFTPFPVDVLPEPVRGFVREAADAIGCDPSYIALPLLSGLAGAVGNACRMMLKKDWTEPCILWTAIVGESGTAKSPAIEIALRPLRKFQADAMSRFETEQTSFELQKTFHERAMTQWKRTRSGTTPPVKPEPPVAERFWTDDVTTEALAVLLQQNPRGLLMVRDELSGWFNFDRYVQGKGGDAAKWLEMFGGRPMVVDRKTGGTIYVARAAVSITGGIQPAVLRRALAPEYRENGLAARLLLASPPRRPKRWSEAEVCEATANAVEEVYAYFLDLQRIIDERTPGSPMPFHLSAQGKKAWVTFFNEHAVAQSKLAGDVAAAWAKLEGYAARFALLFHLVRASVGEFNQGCFEAVDEHSVAAGVALARWFGGEAQRIYALLDETDDTAADRQMREWIETKGGSVTAREVTHGRREFRGKTDAAEKILGELVARGVGTWEESPPGAKGGRPTRRFVLARPSP